LTLGIAVTNLLTGRAEHLTGVRVAAVVKVEFFVKEPVSTSVEGMTASACGYLSRVDSWLVGITRVELGDITAGVDTPSVSMLGGHFLPPS
jgi:hypothetical protein